ncbi:MAG: polysaccharide biosynthesis/export family protein [Pseudomonadota bacterium]
MKTALSILTLALLGAVRCAHPAASIWVDELPAQDSAPPVYRFAVDDQVLVTVWNQPQLSGLHRVRADGMITLPLSGDVAVLGLTPEGASTQIARALAGLVVDPKVTLELAQARAPQVTVLGEVRTPGRFELRVGEGVLELLAQAGGLTEFAARDGIYVLRREGQVPRIRFDYRQLETGEPRAVGFLLRDGDVIIVE